MKSDWYVDFSKLTEKVRAPQIDQRELAIFGGFCPEQELISFLAQWELNGIPYRIWEYVSTIDFQQETLSTNITLLERGRLFGVNGDLSLLRSDSGFEWRFIGPVGAQPPTGDYLIRNYWDGRSKMSFHQYEKTALLWGEFNGKRWNESRVAAARLDYPIKGKRIELVYKEFCRSGHVEFVWYTGLKEWGGSNDGLSLSKSI
jgi:hypothetical protein